MSIFEVSEILNFWNFFSFDFDNTNVCDIVYIL